MNQRRRRDGTEVRPREADGMDYIMGEFDVSQSSNQNVLTVSLFL